MSPGVHVMVDFAQFHFIRNDQSEIVSPAYNLLYRAAMIYLVCSLMLLILTFLSFIVTYGLSQNDLILLQVQQGILLELDRSMKALTTVVGKGDYVINSISKPKQSGILRSTITSHFELVIVDFRTHDYKSIKDLSYNY
jgi:hypothetical protein